jgi:nucleoside-diphosphate-sugar epimerase
MAFCRSLEQVRDYIHIMDLADGHLAALQKLFVSEDIGLLHPPTHTHTQKQSAEIFINTTF